MSQKTVIDARTVVSLSFAQWWSLVLMLITGAVIASSFALSIQFSIKELKGEMVTEKQMRTWISSIRDKGSNHFPDLPEKTAARSDDRLLITETIN